VNEELEARLHDSIYEALLLVEQVDLLQVETATLLAVALAAEALLDRLNCLDRDIRAEARLAHTVEL
jgi:hypothetical protein